MTPRSSSASSSSNHPHVRRGRPASRSGQHQAVQTTVAPTVSISAPARPANDHNARTSLQQRQNELEVAKAAGWSATVIAAMKADLEAEEKRQAKAAAEEQRRIERERKSAEKKQAATEVAAKRLSERQLISIEDAVQKTKDDPAFRDVTEEQRRIMARLMLQNVETYKKRQIKASDKGAEWDEPQTRVHADSLRIYSDIGVLLDLQSVVHQEDVIENVPAKDGKEKMSEANVRYHFESMAILGMAYLGVERSERGTKRYVLAKTPEHLAMALKKRAREAQAQVDSVLGVRSIRPSLS